MKASFATLVLTTLLCGMPAHAGVITNTVTVDGIEWAQVADYSGLSWNDIDSVCPAGICAGTLNGFNMIGWIWADVDAVNGLFNDYIAAAVATPTGYPLVGPSTAVEITSVWAPEFLTDFRYIWEDTGNRGLNGWMAESSVSIVPSGRYARMADRTPGGVDLMGTDKTADATSESNLGAFFYRATPQSDVPVIGTVFLLGLGLLGLRIVRQHTS